MEETWDARLDAVTAWSEALLAGLPEYKAAYDAAYDVTEAMPGDAVHKDLYDMAYEIWASVPDEATEIKATSQAVMATFTPGLIPYEWHQGNKYKTAEGIGIFWPRYVSDLDIPSSRPNDFEYYQTLEFASLTSWDRFLAAYVGVDWPYVP